MGLLILLELYYCCYYPESDAFRDRVASIANLFREKGYDVIMDAMVSSEISSQGPTRWAETQIRRASKVLVFLSPGLLRLAADGCEGLHSQVAFIVTKYVITPRQNVVISCIIRGQENLMFTRPKQLICSRPKVSGQN